MFGRDHKDLIHSVPLTARLDSPHSEYTWPFVAKLELKMLSCPECPYGFCFEMLAEVDLSRVLLGVRRARRLQEKSFWIGASIRAVPLVLETDAYFSRIFGNRGAKCIVQRHEIGMLGELPEIGINLQTLVRHGVFGICCPDDHGYDLVAQGELGRLFGEDAPVADAAGPQFRVAGSWALGGLGLPGKYGRVGGLLDDLLLQPGEGALPLPIEHGHANIKDSKQTVGHIFGSLRLPRRSP